jgi:hypothetical protein
LPIDLQISDVFERQGALLSFFSITTFCQRSADLVSASILLLLSTFVGGSSGAVLLLIHNLLQDDDLFSLFVDLSI